MKIKSINPFNNKVLKEYEAFNDDIIESYLEKAETAYAHHRQTSFQDRADKINAIAGYLEENAEDLGKMITSEMGKPIGQAVNEVKKCAVLSRYYAKNAQRFMDDEIIETEHSKSFVKYLPIGTILGVMPWNFPFWQVFRFVVPNIMAGNTCLLKHASNVPQCAMEIEKIFDQCGFHNAEFQTLMISSDQVDRVIADPRIFAVTLTGSEGAGSQVASTAGKHLKKCVLELGGSDPFIVMPSADIEKALELAVKGRVFNNGQVCIASKRFIIHKEVYELFKTKMVEKFDKLIIGDPMDINTDIGPLSNAKILNELDEQVKKTVMMGAKKLCGAEKIEGEGNFYKPGLLEDIPQESPAYKEELFGPVGALFVADDIKDAVRIANDTRFGLGSVLCSHDQGEIEYAINNIQAGSTTVNAITSSNPALPFGGTKSSGFGRELSKQGIREFCNIKTTVID